MLNNKFITVRGFVSVAGAKLAMAGNFGYFNAVNNLVPFGVVGVFGSQDEAKKQCQSTGGVWSVVEVSFNKLTVLSCKDYK